MRLRLSVLQTDPFGLSGMPTACWRGEQDSNLRCEFPASEAGAFDRSDHPPTVILAERTGFEPVCRFRQLLSRQSP